MVDLDIKGYSFSLMCWIFAMKMRISYRLAVNITYKSDFMVDLAIDGYSFSLMCWIFAMEMRISYT